MTSKKYKNLSSFRVFWVVLGLPDFSYVVVMADRGDHIMPWTAYPVERPHQRQKLEREYLDFWK